MKNRYPDTCFRCGHIVRADEGVMIEPAFWIRSKWMDNGFPRGARTGLLTEHVACRERWRGTSVHWRYDPAPETD